MILLMESRLQNRFAAFASITLLICVMLPAHAGQFIVDVNTDQSVYSPGNVATIYVDLTNSAGSVFNGAVQVVISHLGYVSTNLPNQSVINLGSHSTGTQVFSWATPATNYQGYMVSVRVMDVNSNVVDTGSSAIDVSGDWSKFPRYGYVAQYGSGIDTYNIMWQLKNYHITGVQFYDWQWKHHIPYNPGSTWQDIANRTIYQSTLTNLINAAHYYGMLAISYDDWGAAYSNCLTDGSGVTLSMGRFDSTPTTQADQSNWPLPSGWATPLLYLMNNRDTNWQNYIYGREQQAITNFGFDGWHIDNLVVNQSVYDYNSNYFSLADYNAQFINNAKAAMGKRLTFNTPDAIGENQVAQNADVEFIYSELWSGNPNYLSFNQRVNNVRSFGSKALVMPAYMDSGLSSGSFNTPGVLLTDAAMFACGGAHLELGDGNKMLYTAYFPNDGSVLMSSSLTAALHCYYDFLVGYENLLRGDAVSANNAASITGVTTSTNGNAGSVWIISKKTLGASVIHLVNLVSNTTSAWNDYNGTYPAPPTLTNLAVKMYYSGSINGGRLWYATPDTNSCSATQLNFTTGSDAGGNYVNFTVPQLQYWDMIWLELNGTNSALAQIQAGNYDSMAGIATEVTSDTGGGLDVGYVANTNGDSYVAFNNIDFGSGVTNVSARVASAVANGTIEFRLGSSSGTLIATVPVGNTGGWQSWQTVSAPVSRVAGVQKIFAVFKNAQANLNWFAFTALLPAPWATADIGAVGLAGSASYSGGTFSVTGSGVDIEGTADAFRSVYQPVGPDGEIRARVVSVPGTDPWAKAGVMFRESPASNAVNAAVVVTASNGVAFQQRASTGGVTTSTVISSVAVPQWVRLVRSGTNSFSGYYSPDGTNWTQISTSISLSMSNNAVAGLAVTAHNNALLNTSTFDNVSLNQPPVLSAISNCNVLAGVTLTFTNAASDADVPSQTLTFSLLNAPTNAVLNANSSVFTWRPAIAQSPSTQTVSVAVSDNGLPVMSATQNFSVTVTKPAAPTFSSASLSNGQFQFKISGSTGPDYAIQYSTNLVSWTALTNISSPTVPFLWSNTNSTRFPLGFYRIILGP
jgi:dextranase